jgi:hypothetical protein
VEIATSNSSALTAQIRAHRSRRWLGGRHNTTVVIVITSKTQVSG